MEIDDTLTQRGQVHGDYVVMCNVIAKLRSVLTASPNWHTMSPVQQETLNMLCVKMGRIVTGDASFADHWLDIEGYAKLARTRSKQKMSGPEHPTNFRRQTTPLSDDQIAHIQKELTLVHKD